MRQVRQSAAARGTAQLGKPGTQASRQQASGGTARPSQHAFVPGVHGDGPDGRGGSSGELRRQAWQWALAHRAGDGSLPSGREIAGQYGRHERWGRLVKRSGAAGGFTSGRDAGEPGLAWSGSDTHPPRASNRSVHKVAIRRGRSPERSAHSAEYERLTVLPFTLAAAPRSSHSGAARVVNRRSFQKLGLIPAVYSRVIRRVGPVELVDQLVEPGGQDDDEP
jgi:hypothetical protein